MTATLRRLAMAAAVLAAAGCGGEPGSLAPRGSEARSLNELFWVLVVLGSAVFILVMGVLIRAGAGPDRHTESHDERRSTRLVIGGGVVLPVVILVPLVVFMLVIANRVSPRLSDATDEIRVVGHQFWWEIEYPGTGAVTANEIHIPVGTPVRLILETQDVIHSVWVPQLAGKIDMIPGEQTELILHADEPGTYLGHCTEFCGIQHARMQFLVIAQTPDDFEAWLVNQAAPAAEPANEQAERGRTAFAETGCASCHTVRGTEANGTAGPDLTHLADRTTLGAATIPNTRGHLAGWISDPQGIKPGNLMPPSPLTSEQLLDLIEYLEGLT